MKMSDKRFLGILGALICLFVAFTLIIPSNAFCRGGSSSVGSSGGGRSYSPPSTHSYTPSAPRSYSPPSAPSSKPSWGPTAKPVTPTAPTPKVEVGKSGWGYKEPVAPATKPEVGKPGWGQKAAPVTVADPKKALSGSRTALPAKAPSKVDKAFAEKAKMQGTSFKTRDDAVKDFRAKNEAKFVNKFDKEPSVRPSYIPQTTTVGGSSYTVVYNPGFGGYGYYGPGGWIAYNMWADAVMMSAMMHNHGYYYGQPMVVTYGAGYWIGGFLVLVIVIVLVAVIFGRRNA